MVSSAVLWGLGDILAQRLEKSSDHTFDVIKERHPTLDLKRLAMTTSYGTLFAGVVGHTWYTQLDKIAHTIARPGTVRFVAAKVFADTAFFGPVHVAAFFSLLTLGEGGGFADIGAKLRADFLSTFTAELSVWPAAQALNFKFVPLQFQLLVVNTITILDAAFMSWVQHHDRWLDTFLATTLGSKSP